jgi:hypothetical protein
MCSLKTFAKQSTRETSEARSVEEQADRHVRRLIGFYVHLASS